MSSNIRSSIVSLKSQKQEEFSCSIAEISSCVKSQSISAQETADICKTILSLLQFSKPFVLSSIFPLCDTMLEHSYPAKFPFELLSSIKLILSNQKKQVQDASTKTALSILNIIGPEAFWNLFSDAFSSKSASLKKSALFLFRQTLLSFPDFSASPSSILQLFDDPSSDIKSDCTEILEIIYQRNPSRTEAAIQKRFGQRADEVILAVTHKKSSIPKANQLTKSQIIEQLSIEFQNPLPEATPLSSECQFDGLSSVLTRSADWRKRMETVISLASYARGSSAQAFIRGFRGLLNPFLECLTDTRSTLAKATCLCFAALAKALGPSFDICTDTIIPPLIMRVTNATAVISASADLAVRNFTTYVYGKRIKFHLIDFSKSPSADVRYCVVQCLQIAQQCWPKELSSDIPTILGQKKKDPSDVVHSIVALSEAQENTPSEVQEEVVVEEDVQKVPTFEQSMAEKSAAGITFCIEHGSAPLLGRMDSVIDVLLSEKDNTAADRLLAAIAEMNPQLLFPYIQKIIDSLPEEEDSGLAFLMTLGEKFGYAPIAKLAQSSERKYKIGFSLMAARKGTDFSFTASSILSAIENGQYEKYHALIVILLKKLFEENEVKCEALFGLIKEDARSEILPDISTEIPSLFSYFNTTVDNSIGSKLARMKGGKIDMNVIKEAKGGADLLLAISIIRDCSEYDDEFLRFLMKCTESVDEDITGSASLALQQLCRKRPEIMNLYVDVMTRTTAAIEGFTALLSVASRDAAESGLKLSEEKLKDCLNDPSTRYSALSLLYEQRKTHGDLQIIKDICGNDFEILLHFSDQ